MKLSFDKSNNSNLHSNEKTDADPKLINGKDSEYQSFTEIEKKHSEKQRV